MNFSTEFEDITFIIEVIRDDSYQEPPNTLMARNEKEMLQANQLAFYQLIIKTDEGEDSRTYYLPGILFSTDEEELVEELEGILLDGEILKDISLKLK